MWGEFSIHPLMASVHGTEVAGCFDTHKWCLIDPSTSYAGNRRLRLRIHIGAFSSSLSMGVLPSPHRWWGINITKNCRLLGRRWTLSRQYLGSFLRGSYGDLGEWFLVISNLNTLLLIIWSSYTSLSTKKHTQHIKTWLAHTSASKS